VRWARVQRASSLGDRALSEAKIVESWRNNAHAWTSAVREQRIDSRALVTDRAIVEAVLARAPRSVLDIGCGEGWLARRLAGRASRCWASMWLLS